MFPTTLLIEGQSLPLVVNENVKARRLTLRFYPEADKRIVLTVPPIFSRRQALKFLENSKPWISKQVKKALPILTYTQGMTLPVFGKSYELRHKTSKLFRVWWSDDHVLVHAPSDQLGLFVQKSLQQVAKQFLQARTVDYAQRLGKTVNRITLRDTRSRWGSCTEDGNISYCWRLVFAPESVAAYVCAHEVAHLIEMNHSPQFWKIVGEFCPDYKHLRGWLRQNGKSLFQYGG